jgi:hypothetical protein
VDKSTTRRNENFDSDSTLMADYDVFSPTVEKNNLQGKNAFKFNLKKKKNLISIIN